MRPCLTNRRLRFAFELGLQLFIACHGARFIPLFFFHSRNCWVFRILSFSARFFCFAHDSSQLFASLGLYLHRLVSFKRFICIHDSHACPCCFAVRFVTSTFHPSSSTLWTLCLVVSVLVLLFSLLIVRRLTRKSLSASLAGPVFYFSFVFFVFFRLSGAQPPKLSSHAVGARFSAGRPLNPRELLTPLNLVYSSFLEHVKADL